METTATLPHSEMLAVENERLEQLPAEERVRWAVEQFGDKVILSTSFGIQSAVMLHMVTQIAPKIPVVFVDTGYLFPETYTFADELTKRLDLNLKVYQPLMTSARQEALFGKRWEQGDAALEQYNFMNKVEPMNRAMRELGATRARKFPCCSFRSARGKSTRFWIGATASFTVISSATTCRITRFGKKATFPSVTRTARCRLAQE